MRYKKLRLPALIVCATIAISCSDEKEIIDDNAYVPIPQTSPVVLDLAAVPYPNLSDYHFFDGDMKNLNPVYGVLPFKPATELFSDYALKKRFIWLPDETKATYNGDHELLELPVGAALIKNFYYDNVQPSNTRKIIETRLMIRKADGWIFANYIWNEEQTAAVLDLQGGTVPLTWTDANNNTQTIDYKIPSENQCIICHSVDGTNLPIGVKPQNLNNNYSYPNGVKNQLSKLVEIGYLESSLPSNINSIVDFSDTSKSLDLRVRSYFDINCAHCHQDGGNADYTSPRFAFSATVDPTNMGVCVGSLIQVPGMTHPYIVSPNDISQSILHYMMNTNDTSFKMPRIGRTVVHAEAVLLVEQWINSLEACE